MSFYESSFFIESLLIAIYVMLAAAIGLVVWSALRTVRNKDRNSMEWGFSARKTAFGVLALLVGTLIITGLLADTTPIIINGRVYDDTMWLRVSDMLIWTSGVLVVVASCCVVFASLFSERRGKKAREKHGT